MTKILIVDDSAFARNILGMYVGNGGHEVVGLAGDGEADWSEALFGNWMTRFTKKETIHKPDMP